MKFGLLAHGEIALISQFQLHVHCHGEFVTNEEEYRQQQLAMKQIDVFCEVFGPEEFAVA